MTCSFEGGATSATGATSAMATTIATTSAAATNGCAKGFSAKMTVTALEIELRGLLAGRRSMNYCRHHRHRALRYYVHHGVCFVMCGMEEHVNHSFSFLRSFYEGPIHSRLLHVTPAWLPPG